MKGNIRTLGVFVVSLLLIFVMAGMASAGPTHIKGIYALTGFNSCSVGGAPAGLSIYEADYTFNRDGTGSATAIIRSLSAPDAQGKVTASSVTAEMTFTYEVTKEGDITFGYPNHGNKVNRGQWWMQWDAGPSHGVISPDGKTMTITCGPPVQLTVVDVGGTNAPNLVGTTAYCVTTLSGMRIK